MLGAEQRFELHQRLQLPKPGGSTLEERRCPAVLPEEGVPESHHQRRPAPVVLEGTEPRRRPAHRVPGLGEVLLQLEVLNDAVLQVPVA